MVKAKGTADDVRDVAVKIIPLLPKHDPALAIDILVYTLACTTVAADFTTESIVKGLREYIKMMRQIDQSPDEEWLQLKVNYIEDADLATLRKINERLFDGTVLPDGARRDLANLMWLILGRIETAEVDLKEHQDG